MSMKEALFFYGPIACVGTAVFVFWRLLCVRASTRAKNRPGNQRATRKTIVLMRYRSDWSAREARRAALLPSARN